MFRAYPEEAAKENWLHECLVRTVQAVHSHVDAKTSPNDWKDCIPREHQTALRNYRSIHRAIDAYAKALKQIKTADRAIVLELLLEQNQIVDLLSCICNCRDNKSIPDKLRKAVEDLFYAGFKALTGLGIRDRQYSQVHGTLQYGECPFCGIEHFDSPMQVSDDTEFDNAPREDLDHYLAFCHYAFAGCNLQNLVPSCKRCNESYKHNVDCLRDPNGTRRKSFPLYAPTANIKTRISVSFLNSVPFGGIMSPLPRWVIAFTPDCNETSTWDSMFQVSQRYARDVLTHDTMTSWLGAFGDWCRHEGVVCESVNVLKGLLQKYIKLLCTMRLSGREKLRIPIFEMLLKHCEDGNQRLVKLLCDYASQRVG